MSTNAPHAPGEFGEPPVRPPSTGPGLGFYARKGLKALASLRFTVGLFVFGILLIFFGTLAQLEFGIWTVVDRYFYSFVVMVPTDLIHRFLGVFLKEWYPAEGAPWPGEFPLPGGITIGGLMLINLLAAHATRFRLSWKRLGIFLIHGGLILLFVGEFITREYAVEQRMTIDKGKSVGYAEDARFVELAFVDKSDPNHDTMVTVPERMLRKPKGRITSPDLPVDIEVVGAFMVNSSLSPPYKLTDQSLAALRAQGVPEPVLLRLPVLVNDYDFEANLAQLLGPEQSPFQAPIVNRASADAENPADRGAGLTHIAKVQKEISGLDNNQINFPAVYVRLYKKGTDQALGTYLGSIQLKGDTIEVDGKKYDMGLRYKRYYKPYRVALDEFRFDRYGGTQKPKNYSSDVRVLDGSGAEVRRAHIAMNEPLRYAGETFYQGGFTNQETTTILQVVKNPGWLLPYIACVVVGVGLVTHFGIYLIQFLRRKQPVRAATGGPVPVVDTVATAVSVWYPSRVFPWVMLGIAAAFLLSVLGRMNPQSQRAPYDLDSFSRIEVLEGGRVKPLDTVARVYMRTISHRETFVDAEGNTQPAIKWYLDLLGADLYDKDAAAWKHQVFRIDNDQVQAELKLERREGHRYSLNELRPRLGDLFRKAKEAGDRQKASSAKKSEDPAAKAVDDFTGAKLMELAKRIEMVLGLARFKGPNPHDEDTLRLLPPTSPGAEWRSLGDLRDRSETESELAAMIAARKALGTERLFRLTPDEQQKVVQILLDVNVDRLEPEVQNEVLVKVVQQLMLPPEKVPPITRGRWLEAMCALLPPAETAKIRAQMQDMQKEDWFQLTDQSFDALRNENLPDSVLSKLKTLKDKELRQKDFESEVAKLLGADEKDKFLKLILARAQDLAARDWNTMVSAYRAKKPEAFNEAVAEYRAKRLSAVPPTDMLRTRVETMYNRFAPFYLCTFLYGFGFLLAVVGFILWAAECPAWAVALRKSAFLVLGLALVVHTAALIGRMYITDRPMVFVTNLYSSAVFIGWGCVALCLVLERIFPIGVGNVVASILGLATTIVAHNLGTQDTMEMLEAVLDTNFWLATHVTTVTLGYTATFVAGFLGAMYVLMMLGAVVRDSFESTGEPTVGGLLAFGAATSGLVGIPLFFVWFMKAALMKYELFHSALIDVAFWMLTAVSVMYAFAVLLTRVGSPGTDAQGKPVAGRVPGVAQPLAALALTPESGKILGQMIYGVVCFATMLSFIGTVLGGIWADQSWGRFWGWDPKENGAVLIVLWNSLILHARWCGLVKDRGVAVLALFGNAVTAWSWFGTNQLGIGLHAYGFDSRLADGCFNFWLSQLFIMTLGAAIPRHFWASAARRATATPVASAGGPSANGTPGPNGQTAAAPVPTANGHTHSNGHANGQPRHAKGKKHHRKR